MGKVTMLQSGILYWITGLSGAGKTTIGNRLFYELRKENDNVLLLDGDILKNIVNDEVKYSEEDRRKRAHKYAMLCKMLTDQGMIVICCTVAMFDEVREWNRKNNKGYVEVFLNVPLEVLKERDQKGLYSKFKSGEITNLSGMDMNVEFPKNPDVEINNTGEITIEECVKRIMDYKITFSSDYDRDVQYWNSYYENKLGIEQPSKFALDIGKTLKKSSNLLELGCGNGRDSIYFHHLGMNITAIDASDKVIDILKENYKEKNICFICDDFVCSTVIFAGQYDYVYSRFSLHAINEEQETEVINNVYKVLKNKGKFFVEVRSIHDDLYGKGKKIGENTYIYDGHFRRFVKKEELLRKMTSIGFQIEYAEENIDFAPFKGSNPPVIRIIGIK